jgi:hypothetical protein
MVLSSVIQLLKSLWHYVLKNQRPTTNETPKREKQGIAELHFIFYGVRVLVPGRRL